MALTKEDKQELLDAIRAESQDIGQLETVSSLSGIKGVTALKGDELVSVPPDLLGNGSSGGTAIPDSTIEEIINNMH